MKRFAFLSLILICSNSFLHAQIHKEQVALSETIFNTPKPKSTNVYFDFELKDRNKVTLEMKFLSQLNYLPDLDSILNEVKKAVSQLKYSSDNINVVRRIDYIANNQPSVKLRMVEHSDKPETYSFLNGSLLALKVDSDTLRIIMHTQTGRVENIRIDGQTRKISFSEPFVVMFVVKNISDILSLPENTLSRSVALLKEHAASYISLKKISHGRLLYAYINLESGKVIQPISQRNYQDRKYFVPTINIGIQYARGSFISSAAAGLQYVHENPEAYSTNFFRLLWEPHFFFSRNDNNKLVTDRNDFITLQYIELSNKKNTYRLETTGNVSIGYLVRRKGEWFEQNTFKVSIPGFSFGNFLAEPQFFFNKAFRNFSPSLKLTLLFE